MKKLSIALLMVLGLSVIASAIGRNIFSAVDDCGIFPYEEISGRVINSVSQRGVGNVIVTSKNGPIEFYAVTNSFGNYSVGACADGASYIVQGYNSKYGHTSAALAVSGSTGINLYY